MKKNEKTRSKKGKSLSRRNFIGTVGGASAAFTIMPRHVLGGIGYTPSDLIILRDRVRSWKQHHGQ
jgi:hypothetical protein